MTSFASSTTTCVACKHAWTKIKNFSLGVSPKWVKSKKRRNEKKRERLKVGNNNGQLRIATPPRVAYAKPPGPKKKRKRKKERERRDWKMGMTMASYTSQTPPRVAHAKPSGPKIRTQ